MVDTVLTDQSLTRMKRLIRGAKYDYMEFFSPDIVMYHDDFLGAARQDITAGDVQNAPWFTELISTGGTLGAILADEPNGAMRFVTGATDNSGVDLKMGLMFRGDLNCAVEARVKASAVTTIKFEVGFTDTLTADGIVNSPTVATPTYTAADGFCWLGDTDQDTQVRGYGVKATVGATIVQPGAGVGILATTYMTYGCGAVDDNIRYWIKDASGNVIWDNIVHGTVGYQANGVTKTVKLTPYIMAQNRAVSASRNFDIDYVRVWQRRA